MRDEGVHVLICTECPRVSSVSARGWKAYRVDDPEFDEPPRLAFYCPSCAAREFGIEQPQNLTRQPSVPPDAASARHRGVGRVRSRVRAASSVRNARVAARASLSKDLRTQSGLIRDAVTRDVGHARCVAWR
jgi:hypothetical protein